MKKCKIGAFLLLMGTAYADESMRGQLNNLAADAGPMSVQSARALQARENVQNVADQLTETAKQTLMLLEGQSRLRDPFGLSSEPTSSKTNGSARQAAAATEQRSPFLLAMQQLAVDGINPQRHECYSGPYVIKQGGKITVSYDGKRFRANVERVLPRKLILKDAATNEIVTVSVDVIPSEE